LLRFGTEIFKAHPALSIKLLSAKKSLTFSETLHLAEDRQTFLIARIYCGSANSMRYKVLMGRPMTL
jgi:hypothetical protein